MKRETVQTIKVSSGGVAPQTNSFPGRKADSHRRRLSILILILSDVLLAFLAWEVSDQLRVVWSGEPPQEIMLTGVVPSVAVWIGLRALLGLYPGYGLDHVEDLRRQTHAAFAALAATVVFTSTSGAAGALLGWPMLMTFLGILLLSPMARYFVKWIMLKTGLWGKPVIVLGSRESEASLLSVLHKEWQLGFEPVMIPGNRRLATVGEALEDMRLGGDLSDSMDLAQEREIDTIIFAVPSIQREHLAKLVSMASTSFRYVIVMSNLSGITNSAVTARDFAGTFGIEIKHNLLDPWARKVKRVLDLLASVVGGLLISPLLIAVAILIKLDSSGPIFYGHRRLGAGDGHFRCWKFRTMHRNAGKLLDEHLGNNPHLRAEWEQNQKLHKDPRVTRIGLFLRKTSLDELPQLWNVLLGEMSLVGPRPIVDAEIPKYGAAYEMYRRIRPGISGLWQVSGRSDTSYAKRVELDAYFVHNWSVWLDLVILARTVWNIVLGRGRGAY